MARKTMEITIYDLKTMVAKCYDWRKGVFIVLSPKFSPCCTPPLTARKDDNKIFVNTITLGRPYFDNK